MAKKQRGNFLFSQATTYADLLRRAEKSLGKRHCKNQIPRPWNVNRLWREDPCGLLEEGCHGNEKHKSITEALSYAASALFSMCVLLTIIKGGIFLVCGELISLLVCLVTGLILAIFAFWLLRYPSWIIHRSELNSIWSKGNNNSEEMLRTYLLGQFDGMKEEFLGDASSLRVLQKKMREQLERAKSTRDQLGQRCDLRPEGEHKERLKEKCAALDALIARLTAALNRLDAHVVKLTSYLSECRMELEGVASDLTLMEEADAVTREGEQSMEQVDDVVLSSLIELQGRITNLQENTRQLFGEIADTRFSSSRQLSQDLAAFESLVESALAEPVPNRPLSAQQSEA